MIYSQENQARHIERYEMICNHSTFSFMFMITITLVLLPLLGNAQKIPTIGCPFNLSCNHNKKIIELPAYPVPIKLLISHINYTSQVLRARDPENCLPRLLLLQSNFTSSIFPFRIIYESALYEQFGEFTNISFFECSSLVQRYLNDSYQLQGVEQEDMISCSIFMAGFRQNMVRLNLVSCTKLSQRVSPLFLPEEPLHGLGIRQNSISLSWSETNLDKGCFKCSNKSKKIILSSAGETHSLLYFIWFDFGVGSDLREFFFLCSYDFF